MIHTLPHADKLRLKQVLDNDLALEEEFVRLMPSGECPIWSPYNSYEAAAIMQEMLEQEKLKREEDGAS